jgi:hypothetical protein
MDQELLGSWDLPEDRDVVVTIDKCIGGELTGLGGKKSKKPVVTFVGKEKKMVFNVTNCKAVAGMYGNHVEKWAGKRISLYVTTTRDPSSGGEVPCIRVRPKVPADGKESPAPAETGEI